MNDYVGNVKNLIFRTKKGKSRRKARKYLNPAMLKGPIKGSRILMKIKDVEQIIGTKITMKIGTLGDRTFFVFIRTMDKQIGHLSKTPKSSLHFC